MNPGGALSSSVEGPKGLAALRLVPRWPGWRHLPRDARDTLFLLAVIGWTVLPHVTHLPWWCIGLSALVLLWRTRLAIANAPLPGRWTLAGVLAVIAVLTLIDFRTLLGKEAGVSLLVALVALKTLELRARRDAFVVFFLGFFLVLTQFLYSQTIATAVSMIVSTWGLLTALVLAHMPVGRPPFKLAAWLAARTALLGAPIMALLFVLFPRVGPLWGVPQDGTSRTGLSESMQLGSMAELALDDSIAMRLRFTGQEPPPQAMYFRGPVLSEFNGRDWTPAADFTRPAVPTQLRVTGFPITYELTLEPQKIRVLPLLEVSPRAPEIPGSRVRLTDDLQWTTIRPIVERTRLTAQAYVDFQHGPTAPSRSLRAFVQLPPGFNPRTLAWAAAFRNEPQHRDAPARALANDVLRVISTAGYTYTLSPGEYGKDAVDEFWLDRKEGFCEHFAAAFVVIMRAMDVPARIVTGYQGAERNPVDGTYIVRQSAAHAWAEYWQEGSGWIRADPTAAVAPDRIVRSRNLLPPPGFMASALDGMNPALWTELRHFWDAANNGWNQWVLNYTRTEQFGLLERLGFKSPDWEDLARLTAGVVVVIALAGIAWAWLDKRKLDPWQRQLQRIHAALRGLGIEASAHDTPRHLAGQLVARYGAAAGPLVGLLQSLERQRYSRDALSSPARTLAWNLPGSPIDSNETAPEPQDLPACTMSQDILVTPEQLAAHPEWRVFDVRHDLMKPDAGEAAYAAGHIPGALHAHLDRDLSSGKTGHNGRHPWPDAAAFADWLGRAGLRPDDTVVAYDAGDGAFAARLWWLLRSAGHERVAVLDGGWSRWVAENRPQSHEVPRIESTRYPVSWDTGRLVNVDDVRANLASPDFTVIDARAANRYEGRDETIDPVAGHIPGALNRPYASNLEGGRFKPAPRLRAEFEALLGHGDKSVAPGRVVHQCGSGVTACHNLLAMELAGLPGSRLYPGSWSEWCSDPARPVATGPTP